MIMKMSKTAFLKKYHSRFDHCCKCGAALSATISLGYFFVMDYNGNFYCTECDKEFIDGDERIFEPDLEDNDE
jgi:hypothetical protein